MTPQLQDIFFSEAADALRSRLLAEAQEHSEMESISVDATLRCCFPLLGQASYRASAATRSQAAFDDAHSLRRARTST